jgi:hypothetical protein
VWFGEWPEYLPCFLSTAKETKYVNWLIFSDNEVLPINVPNIFLHKISTQDFKKLARKALGVETSLSNPYKLCDYKPFYGDLFKELLEDYKYWGHCDLDILVGDLDKDLKYLRKSSPDVISFYQSFISGPICIYKNNNVINKLYREISDFENYLKDPEHIAIDENNNKTRPRISILRRIHLRFSYAISGLISGRLFRLGPSELRYRYQWYQKRMTCLSRPALDMTDVVFQKLSAGKIDAIFKDLLESDRQLSRSGLKNWEISWMDGKLFRGSKTLTCFHYPELKNKIDPSKIQAPIEHIRMNRSGLI